MKKLGFTMAAACLLAAPWAHAQSTDSLQARSWAASCANCHGTNGRAEPGMASLAGVRQADLARKLKDYKEGRLPATIMHQLAKGYTDEQLEAIAAFFAAQKP